jgi:hypothetical protein
VDVSSREPELRAVGNRSRVADDLAGLETVEDRTLAV